MKQSETLAPNGGEQPQTQPRPSEKPIIFSSEMVKAILEGRKSQTRRVLQIQPILAMAYEDEQYQKTAGKHWTCYGARKIRAAWPEHGEPQWDDDFCPYGKPGDRLWVRETFEHSGYGAIDDIEIRYSADGHVEYMRVCETDRKYRTNSWKKRPAIHMPRWASRLTLEILKVRVERVQDISEEDAKAEGALSFLLAHCSMCHETFPDGDVVIKKSGADICPRCDAANFTCAFNGEYECACGYQPDAVEHFEYLWDKINSKRQGGKYAWNKNPWVWVEEFRRVKA
jgi:hypothetical protein